MQANIISIQEASRNLNTINAQNKRNALHFFCLTKPSNLSIKNKITRKNKCKQVHYTEGMPALFLFHGTLLDTIKHYLKKSTF